MKSPVALAFAGGIHASAAIPWLVDTLGVEVVTVTLDVGQGHELGELRARALACGAVRAHVVDARDDFARDVLFPLLVPRARSDEPPPSISTLAWPLIARRLTEIARIEGAGAVAHGSADPAFDAQIHGIDASMPILAPAREWTMSAADVTTYVRARRLPVVPAAPDCRIDQNLWGRVMTWEGAETPAAARAQAARVRPSEPALVDIHFERGIPTSVSGVPMSPAELIECLSLIASQHGVGRTNLSSPGPRHVVYEAPAATILRAAASEVGESTSADVCLRLADGLYSVLSPSDRHSLLVNYA